jgi:hypothetical protein
VLVALGSWPAEAALRIHACGRDWAGLAAGDGLLANAGLDVRVEGNAVRTHARVV